MNKSELLLSGKLLYRTLSFHRFLLRVIFLKIHQLYWTAGLCILSTFPTIMCLQPFLKIIRPAGVQSFITAFYNVCIISLILLLFVSLFHYLSLLPLVTINFVTQYNTFFLICTFFLGSLLSQTPLFSSAGTISKSYNIVKIAKHKVAYQHIKNKKDTCQRIPAVFL